jgi:hypothetical protein
MCVLLGTLARSRSIGIEKSKFAKSKIAKMKKSKFANREIQRFCKAFGNLKDFKISPSGTTEMMGLIEPASVLDLKTTEAPPSACGLPMYQGNT